MPKEDEKVNTCHDNPKKSLTTKINKHTSSVIHCLQIVHMIQQKISLIMKNFCLDLREHARKTINYKKKRNGTTNN